MEEPNLVKKNLTEKIMDKKKQVLIIAVFCIITLFLGTSYALLTNFDKTDNVITIKSGNLTMTVANDLITLSNKLPESDTDGLANATPVIITLTNTGTMDIAIYDVKLVKEDSTTNVSTLEDQYIKYAISKDGGNTYSSASTLTTNDNIIFAGYNLAVNESTTIYLKTWIDENAKNNAVGKTYYGSIKVDLYQDDDFSNFFKANLTSSNSITEDGITYISGAADDIDFNYVWYSGKLWRITAINPDGTMKMITDDAITTISYGNDVNFYTDNENKSYMYQWLNEDFLDTLYNYENIIVTDSKWNSLTTEDITTKITEGAEGVTTITSPVGLLNSYEYYMSYKNASKSNGYLNIGYSWWLLNSYNTSNVWYVNSGGNGFNISPTNTYGGRPSINLKSEIQLSGGSGTKTDPYTIAGDKEEVTAGTTLLNTRSSGEYVKFNNELYRIVSIENEITKINKNDYVRDTSNNVLTKQFSTSVTYGGGTTDDYWDYYLNNTWYNALDSTSQNMIVENIYYVGMINRGKNYKNSICAAASNAVTTKDCEKTTSTWTGLVGLPRYGEMFASQQGSEDSSLSNISNMWLMNPESTSDVWDVRSSCGDGNSNIPTAREGGRPSINLKSSIKITGGNGTKDNPFEISE